MDITTEHILSQLNLMVNGVMQSCMDHTMNNPEDINGQLDFLFDDLSSYKARTMRRVVGSAQENIKTDRNDELLKILIDISRTGNDFDERIRAFSEFN